jgi:hypothetical protein
MAQHRGAAEVGAQRLGNRDRAVGVLEVLEQRHQRAPDGEARAVEVCTSSFFPCAFLKRVCIRRAWKASQFETELISR